MGGLEEHPLGVPVVRHGGQYPVCVNIKCSPCAWTPSCNPACCAGTYKGFAFMTGAQWRFGCPDKFALLKCADCGCAFCSFDNPTSDRPCCNCSGAMDCFSQGCNCVLCGIWQCAQGYSIFFPPATCPGAKAQGRCCCCYWEAIGPLWFCCQDEEMPFECGCCGIFPCTACCPGSDQTEWLDQFHARTRDQRAAGVQVLAPGAQVQVVQTLQVVGSGSGAPPVEGVELANMAPGAADKACHQ